MSGPDETVPDAAQVTGTTATAWKRPSAGRWAVFVAIAAAVVVLDQLAKGWIVSNLAVGEGFDVLGDWIRIIHGRNSGILFGMLPNRRPRSRSCRSSLRR